MEDEVREGEGRRGRGGRVIASTERNGKVDLRDVELVLDREFKLDGGQQQVRLDHRPERDRAFARSL